MEASASVIMAVAYRLITTVILKRLFGPDGKESGCNAGDLGSIPGLGKSHEGGHGNLLQYSCLENPHGQRSLVGYSPWGLKELVTTATKPTQDLCSQINKY